MNIPFEPLEGGGYRNVYRLALTVTAFFETHQHWPDRLIANREYLIDLFDKIPKDWHEPVLKRLRFELSDEADALIVADSAGRAVDYSTAAQQREAQAGCDWLFSKPVKMAF